MIREVYDKKRTDQAARASRAGTGPLERTNAARLPLIGLLAIQILIGYEWLISGVTKIVRGGFPAGLAEELAKKSAAAPGWYVSFLDSVVIPNAGAFGYIIEIAEILAGIGLIGAALVWLIAWPRMIRRAQLATLSVTVVAALAGVFMNVNFHLANGSPHPWFIPKEGFDEGVDLDSLMPLIELAIASVAGGILWRIVRSSNRPRREDDKQVMYHAL